MSSSFLGNVVKDNEVAIKVKTPFDLIVDSTDSVPLSDKLNAVSKGQFIKTITGNTPSFVMEADVWFNALSNDILNITVTANSNITDRVINSKLSFSLNPSIELTTGWLRGGTNTIIKWQYDEPLPNTNGVIYVISLSQVITSNTTAQNSVIFANLESIIPLTDTVTPTGSFGLAQPGYEMISNKGERIVEITGTAPNMFMKHDTIYLIDASENTSVIHYDLSNLVTTPFVDDTNTDLKYTATSEIWIKTNDNIPTITWDNNKIWLAELDPTIAPTLQANKLHCFVVRRISETQTIINLAYVI